MAIYGDQVGEITTLVENQFHKDVLNGLRASPKYLQSKYFYDAAGDLLFQEIMKSPEYYLTNAELEILSQQTNDITQLLVNSLPAFDIIELGAGDATKSIYVLKNLVDAKVDFTYFPVDISSNVIRQLEAGLPVKLPGLQMNGLHGEYLQMIRKAGKLSSKRKVVLFLGANIGNFTVSDASAFLRSVAETLQPGDLMVTGFDLKKNPRQILAAYNDAAGITRQFNLNLLTRINRELGADFDLHQFEHYPTYDPITGACKSYLVSLRDQVVSFTDTEIIHFQKNEPVHTERSQKYSLPEINKLARETGFKPLKDFFDSRQWFLDAVWSKV